MHISRVLVRAPKYGAQISTRRSQEAWKPIIQCHSRLCSDSFMMYGRGPTCTACRSNQCITFEQHVSGCSLSKFRDDASTCKKEVRRPAAKLQITAECVRSGFQPKYVSRGGGGDAAEASHGITLYTYLYPCTTWVLTHVVHGSPFAFKDSNLNEGDCVVNDQGMSCTA